MKQCELLCLFIFSSLNLFGQVDVNEFEWADYDSLQITHFFVDEIDIISVENFYVFNKVNIKSSNNNMKFPITFILVRDVETNLLFAISDEYEQRNLNINDNLYPDLQKNRKDYFICTQYSDEYGGYAFFNFSLMATKTLID